MVFGRVGHHKALGQACSTSSAPVVSYDGVGPRGRATPAGGFVSPIRDLKKGSLTMSIDSRKAKQAPDFDWLYESPDGEFSVACSHEWKGF